MMFPLQQTTDTPSQQKQNRGRGANGVFRLNMNGPAVVDVIARIAVVGEARADAELRSEFPNRIGQRTADAGDPTSSKLHRHAAKRLLADPAADAIRRLQNHQVLNAVLSQHLRRSDTFKSKQTQNEIPEHSVQELSPSPNNNEAEELTGDAGTDDDDGGARGRLHHSVKSVRFRSQRK